MPNGFAIIVLEFTSHRSWVHLSKEYCPLSSKNFFSNLRNQTFPDFCQALKKLDWIRKKKCISPVLSTSQKTPRRMGRVKIETGWPELEQLNFSRKKALLNLLVEFQPGVFTVYFRSLGCRTGDYPSIGWYPTLCFHWFKAPVLAVLLSDLFLKSRIRHSLSKRRHRGKGKHIL